MEKYGVDTDTPKEKVAEVRGVAILCPHCQVKIRPASETGTVRLCPNCGSEPFEHGNDQ